MLADQVASEFEDHTRLFLVLIGGIHFLFLVEVLNKEERNSLSDLWEMYRCLIHVYDSVLIVKLIRHF